MRTERMKNIEFFLQNFVENKNVNKEEKYQLFLKENKKHLIGFKRIRKFNELELGTRIRYIKFDGSIGWGGILLKTMKKGNNDLLILKNSSNNIFNIEFNMNYVFFKKPEKRVSKMKKIILELIN